MTTKKKQAILDRIFSLEQEALTAGNHLIGIYLALLKELVNYGIELSEEFLDTVEKRIAKAL